VLVEVLDGNKFDAAIPPISRYGGQHGQEILFENFFYHVGFLYLIKTVNCKGTATLNTSAFSVLCASQA